MHLACLNNHYEVAKFLIEKRHTDFNIKTLNNQTPLHLAIERHHYEIIKLLVENNCNVNDANKEGDTPLHCLLRNYNMIQLKQIYMPDKISKNITKVIFYKKF